MSKCPYVDASLTAPTIQKQRMRANRLYDRCMFRGATGIIRNVFNDYSRVRSQATGRWRIVVLVYVGMLTPTYAQVAPPELLPKAVDSATSVDVVVTSSTPGAVLRYTTNGEDPLSTHPQLTNGSSIRIDRSCTLSVAAWSGTERSATTQASYRITGSASMGDYHGLSMSVSGKVWSWGQQGSGRLGNGLTATYSVMDPSRTLDPPGNLDTARAINAGTSHSLAVDASGTVKAFGWNGYGLLGNGTTTTSAYPVDVLKQGSPPVVLDNAVGVAAGTWLSLALLDDGSVWSWGARSKGRLGNGATSGNQLYAGRVRTLEAGYPPLSGIRQLAAKGSFGVAREPHEWEESGGTGRVWSWGDNVWGQLGAGHTYDQSRARLVMEAYQTPLTEACQSIVGPTTLR